MFTELYREEKREEGDRGGQQDKGGESKEERQIQPVITSLCALHSLDCSEMFTELEEKSEEGDRGGQEDKKRGLKRRQTDPAINQFPKCSPLSGTHRNSQSLVE